MKNKYILPLLLITTLVATTSLFAQQIKVVPFLLHGGRVDWDKKGISYDFLDTATGFYEMAVINPNGSGFNNITKGVAHIPQKNNGNPAWYYPTGRYIVYEAEKDSNYSAADKFYGTSANATPGIGLNCDLWVVDLQTKVFTRLTNLPTRRTAHDTIPTSGVLHPQFSHDGTKLLWSECINAADTSRGTTCPGLWEMNISVHYTTGGILGDFTFLETSGGFSPDDSTVIYCANAIPGQLAGYIDIYSFNIYTNQLKNLTPDTNVWDEHSHFTFNGNQILWISSNGYNFIDDVSSVPKTDFWMMDKDGSNKKQVTFFNNIDSAEHTYADGGIVTVGDNAWSPFGGDSAICYVQVFGTSTSHQIFYLINAQASYLTSVPAVIKDSYGFNCYPNPAENTFNIDLSGLPSEPVDIRIYNVFGDLVYTEQINTTQQTHTIQTGNLAKGIYLIRAISASGVANKKMVIE